jgi:uncharacterized integral membrane protein (TIGR00698 family)
VERVATTAVPSSIAAPARDTAAPREAVLRWAPGLALVLAIAVVARISGRYTGAIPDVVIALLTGIVVRNAFRLPAITRVGVSFTLRYILRTAIILLGAGLSLAAIVKTGASTLVLILFCCTVAMGLGLLLARTFGLPGVLGTLIGAGTAICGGTAILAIAPMTRAKDEDVAYAITTIFTFNIIALLIYPPLGHLLDLSASAFGSWTGTAVNDTSVVVATGYVYSQSAGAVATIVKLTRTVLLVPMAITVGLVYAARFARKEGSEDTQSVWQRTSRTIPWFVLGFVAMAGLNSVNLFPAALDKDFTTTAAFLIVMVLAAVGLNVDLKKILRMGLKPLFVGLLLASVMSVVSLTVIHILRIGG